MNTAPFRNPFKPGAGHMPPYLAGRKEETQEFLRLLDQETILENLILTGLRGVGKTVLLDTFKPLAMAKKWLWVGTDLSESASISEQAIVVRLLTDLSVVTSNLVVSTSTSMGVGFGGENQTIEKKLTYDLLLEVLNRTPGLLSDKLKQVLAVVWTALEAHGLRGIVFAYDEAQTMSDHAAKEQLPLSLLLDVFQSVQRREMRFLLVLVGLPTLFPKLVVARTFSERMFRVVSLGRLSKSESRAAILKPISSAKCPICFDDNSVNLIINVSSGYPYFIQFICKEVYDIFLQQLQIVERPLIPIESIIRKLDTDFFAGRWAKATDRQRELLWVIASLKNSDEEFTVQDAVEMSHKLPSNAFSSSHANQMLATLSEMGLIYKNRHGRYSFAVPLLGQFILRQKKESQKPAQEA